MRYFFCFLIFLLPLTGCRPALQPLAAAPATTLPVTRPALTVTVSPSPVASATSTAVPATLLPTASATPTMIAATSADAITRLLFTGVIVPARCVQASIDASGNPNYPYEKVKDVISSADLAVGVLNATISDQSKHSGCNWSYQMVGGASNADAMAWAGFDIMSIASNHIKDCGLNKSWCNETFLDTLDNLKRVGVQPVGGGRDLQEALQPVTVTVNGTRFGFVSLGEIKMDESVFAGVDYPGIARLTPDNLRTSIGAARQAADVVIVLPHWGPEDIAKPNGLQLNWAKQIVADGANIVVGNHTHVVQAIQEINGVPVFYGLGNFVFDQWYPDHRQGVILILKFQGKQYLGYELIPTHVDQDGQVFLAGTQEAAEILKRIEQVSQGLK
jgi:hypothetical protein